MIRAPQDLTPQQRDAIASRERDVFLEAGAGTGKTGVLVERYCAAITEDGVDPSEILAFTFTEKAADELRQRIRRRLEQLAEAASGTDRTRLEDALRSLGAAPITTIHGFCRRLLAAHPVAAGIDPRFRVLDEGEADRLARAAFDTALGEFLASGDAARETTVAAYRVRGLSEAVRAAYQELRSRGEPQPRLPQIPPTDPEPAFEELERAAAECRAAGDANATQLAKMERALELATARGARIPSPDELAPLGFSAKPEDSPRAACGRAIGRTACALAEAGEGRTAYQHLSELLELFGRRYAEAKARRSGLDFEDLQLAAVALLGSSEAIGERYRERFRHVLVDEFQDTNALQLALVALLDSPETSLFVVGDEFQSIYGFRHADVEVFRAQREEFRGRERAEVIPLSGNFRSRPEILALANRVGAAMLGEDFNRLSPGAPGSDGAPRGGDGPVELLLTEPDGWEELDLRQPLDDATRPACVAEARALALRLRELADAGVPREDMVVLLRAFTRVDAFEHALAQAGLNPYVVGGRGYWSQQQVEDVRCLLSVIANPLADEPLLGAMASPACGVAPDTLWLLRRGAGQSGRLWPALLVATREAEIELEEPEALVAIPEGDREKLVRLVEVIERLRGAGTRLPLEELVEGLVVDTGYDIATLLRPGGRRRLANVRKMMRLAREFEADEGRDLRAFLDSIDARAVSNADAVAATVAEGHDGVRVMTVHAAKGLEFEVVAVADLGRGLLVGHSTPPLVLGRDGEPAAGLQLRRLGYRSLALFDYEALADAAKRREEAEALRLFYVAVTRARERLLLSGVPPARTAKETRGRPVIEQLLAALEGDGALEDKLLVRVNRASPERAAELCNPPATRESEAEPARGTAAPLVSVTVPPPPSRSLSYSALQAYGRCGYRFYVERVLGLGAEHPASDDGERERRFGFGTAVHELLAWSARNRWRVPRAARVSEELRRAGADASEEAAERAMELIAGWTASPTRNGLAARGTTARAEVSFLIRIGGSVLRGSIDLLAQAPGAPPLLVDYKTDRLDGDPPAVRAERYAVQRDLYALAAAEALGVEQVRVAYVFLERPDEPVEEILGPIEIAAARERLERLVAKVRAGEFEVTPEPTWELCHDCPARARLCPAPAAAPAPATAA